MEDVEVMKAQFPDFNFEDKVVSREGSIVRPNVMEKDRVWKVYYRRKYKNND